MSSGLGTFSSILGTSWSVMSKAFFTSTIVLETPSGIPVTSQSSQISKLSDSNLSSPTLSPSSSHVQPHLFLRLHQPHYPLKSLSPQQHSYNACLSVPPRSANRWKGENVATTEVAEVLEALDFLQEVNIYGVTVPGA